MMDIRYYKVKVHPDARENRVVAKKLDAFEIWVKASAERGQANSAVLALLALQLGIEAKRLRIVKGATSPSKIITVLG
jgi:uncharacterized protein YggU (UPF0235/DUF167 family)